MLVVLVTLFLWSSEWILSATSYPYGSNLHQRLFNNIWSYPADNGISYLPDQNKLPNLRRINKRQAPPDVQNDFEIPTRPDYKNGGSWAKGKTPVKVVDLDWVPLQIYSQVRRYDTEKHLPREAALEEASTPEEEINAPRLREVVSHKKIQEVYEEEGFEDSGYDHAGYNHQGAHYEDKNKQEADGNNEKLAEPNLNSDENSNIFEQELSESSKNTINNLHPIKSVEDMEEIAESDDEKNVSVGSHKSNKQSNMCSLMLNGKEPTESEGCVDHAANGTADDQSRSGTVVFPGVTTKKYKKNPSGLNSGAGDFINDKHHKSHHSAIKSHLQRMKLYPLPNIPTQVSLSPILLSPQTYSNKYFNHLLKNNSPNYKLLLPNYEITIKEEPFKTFDVHKHKTSADTLAAYAALARQNVDKSKQYATIHLQSDILTSTVKPETSKGKTYYNNITRIVYKRFNGRDIEPPAERLSLRPTLNTRHPSVPRDNREASEYDFISANSGPSIISLTSAGPNIIPSPANDTAGAVKYIEKLTIAHFSSPKINYIPHGASETRANRFNELAKILNSSPELAGKLCKSNIRKKRAVKFDKVQYPFYNSNKIEKDSALQYASNPALNPDKRKGGMVFYELRDKMVDCEEPTPPRIPNHSSNEGEWNKDPNQENLPRVVGLGNKILCLKKRYFGENPLDNPFFKEDAIDDDGSFELDGKIPTHFFKLGVQEPPKNTLIRPKLEERNSTIHSSDEIGTSEYKDSTNISGSSKSVRWPNEKINAKSHLTVQPQVQFEDLRNLEDMRKIKVEGFRLYPPHNHHYLHRTHMQKPKMRYIYRPHRVQFNNYPPSGGINSPPKFQTILYASSEDNPIMVPVKKINNRFYAENMPNALQYKPGNLYYMRPGEYTERKDLVNKVKEPPSIWNYLNPLRWWFPSWYDNRRKEPRYRKKRDLISKFDKRSSNDAQKASQNTKEEIIPPNHKAENTTNSPISIEEFKAKFNITDKPITRLDMITGNFITINTPESKESDKQISNVTKLTTVESSELLQQASSMETTTSSTLGTSQKPRLLFPRTKFPSRKFDPTRKSSVQSRRGSKYSTVLPTATTFSKISVTPPYIDKKPIKSANKINFSRPKLSNRHRYSAVITETTTTAVGGEIQERPTTRKYDNLTTQKVESRRVMKEEFKTKNLSDDKEKKSTSSEKELLPSGGESTSDQSNVKLFPSNKNATLTYLVDPTTGNGSWEYLRKLRGKGNRITSKKQHKVHSPLRKYTNRQNIGGPLSKESIFTHEDTSSTTENINEAYIIGLMSKVAPTTVDRNKHYARRNQQIHSPQTVNKHLQHKQSFLPKYNNKIPLKFILQPDKRKYYYVVN